MRKRKYTIAAGILLFLVSALALDYAVGYKQNRLLHEKAAMKKKMEQLAWYTLRAEVKRVEYIKDKYRITIRYENAFPEEALYFMTPQLRCFIQVGTLWKEVPLLPPERGGGESAVTRLDGEKNIDMLVEVPFRNFEEVLPGYMHVRINSMSYIASDALSKEDIVEKNEDFYIYLKPYYARDDEMLKKYTFTNNEVPVFIPMPPH
ncbi:MAG: hypothetical protein K8I29_02520 [Alphaproteobacteria bacterium]|uniref:Uncharacterized protein n=1 Tax=Candidatus Nitrobium versatile TaxID=2884831 RepID=A0A953M0Y4_9BACT|nr:hypothetical protein [Candidatus Nitrobium versatile]